MRDGAKPGTAKSPAGEWDGAAWDRLMARWVEDVGLVDFEGRDVRQIGPAARTSASAASSGFPAVIDLASLDGSNGFTINGAHKEDFSGNSVSSAGDVNGDGIDDFIIGAPGGNNPPNGESAGKSYVVFGRAEGFGASFELSSLNGSNGFRILGAHAGDRSGDVVSSAGDVNGDGFYDIIIGANRADPGGDRYAGESYVVFGSADGFARVLDLATLDGNDGFAIKGIRPNDLSGNSVSSAGDINGDGFDDVIIGALGATRGQQERIGESYVIFGKAGGFTASIDLKNLDGTNGFRLEGVAAGDDSGSSVSTAGDVNGDGFDDIIVGARNADPGDYNAGASYVVFGHTGGFAASFDLAGLDGTNGFRIDGIDVRDSVGSSVSSAGDVNGDGLDDVIIGTFGAGPTYEGVSYVVFGRAGGFAATLDLATLDGRNGFSINGINAYDGAGLSVSSAGDVNGDGFDDVIVGAVFADPGGVNGAGESYVVFGKAGGFAASNDLATLDGSNGFRLDGIDAGDRSGESVSAAGDINGDGFDDIIIGAVSADPNGDYSGESYVVYGRAPDEAVRRGGSVADQTIRGGAFNDTLLGKGGDDTLAGGAGKDRLIGGEGADHFEFASVSAADADRITDFTAGADEIALDGDIFGLPEGALAAGRFVIGNAAQDANDRLIYNSANGQLFFDADGTGAEAQVLIATLTGAPVIAVGDIVVI